MPQIILVNPYNQMPLLASGDGLQDADSNQFPLINGAYHFVKQDNYTANFGYQWNLFSGTQIDKSTNIQLSQNRFFCTNRLG